MVALSSRWQSFSHLYQKEIWKTQYLADRSFRGRAYAVLRIVSITLTGLVETKAVSRAAALSFSSLLGLGPLVAIAVLVAGFVLDTKDPQLAVKTLNRVIRYIAPPIAEYEKLSPGDKPDGTAAQRSDVLTAANLGNAKGATGTPNRPATSTPNSPSTPTAGNGTERAAQPAGTDPASPPIKANSALVEMMDGFIKQSRSGAAGALGAITFIIVVLQLFTSVENAFNEIWGVRRGRSWLMRVVFYWTVLTLGTVVFFAAATGLSAGAYLNTFAEKIPLGQELKKVLQFLLPSFSGLLLVGILTLFYRCIPNTRVAWRAAFVGAAVVAALIILNNFLSFLYLSRVVQQKSLWGSLGVLPILMFGLYIFWLFVLLGGQISYAVQNVHFRNSQAAWHNLAESMRERLSLIVLLTICRRFHDCRPPCTASQLGIMLKVPTQILNECINRLVNMRLVTPIPPSPNEDATDYRYQPARPLNRVTLRDFKTLDDDFGDDPTGPTLANLDPIVGHYNREASALTESAFFQHTIEELFNRFPIDTSTPPFALGETRRE